ncbi:hypothetical protein Tco_0378830 [Tanacetum coccineum]
MIQVKEMMQDNDLKNSKSKDKGSKSRSQSMDEQSHYKQDKTITRQSINVKRHIFNVIGDTEKFEERDLNIGGDYNAAYDDDPKCWSACCRIMRRGNGNQNGDAVNDNIRGDVSRDCTYKDFLACNLKEYDGKGGAIVYTHWIQKIESVQDMSGCRDSQKVKYTVGSFVERNFFPSNEMQKLETKLWNHAMVGADHAAYSDRFHELARLVPHLVTPEGTLTDEALRNGSIKKNPEKRGNEGEPSKDRNVRDDNKRTRTENYFATTANPVRGGYMGTAPKCITCSYHHSPETP